MKQTLHLIIKENDATLALLGTGPRPNHMPVKNGLNVVQQSTAIINAIWKKWLIEQH
jgi:hypothetical protein